MNLLFLHSADEAYGSDRILLQMAEARHRAGDRVLVLLPADSPGTWLTTKLRESGIEVEKVPLGVARRKYLAPRTLPRYLASLLRARGVVRNAAERFGADLIHINTSALVVGALVGRPNRARRVWHVHEIVRKPKALARLLRRLPLTADCVIAVSQAVKDHLADGLDQSETNIRVLHNGIRSPDSLSERSRGRNVLYVGRLSQWKGYDLFVEMAMSLVEEFPDVTFQLAGDAVPGEEYRLTELRGQIQAAGLESRVTVLGFRSDTERLFTEALVTVVPSLEPDPLPTVVLEAMRCGSPVVGSAHGGIPEMVEHGKTGLLFSAGDVMELRAAVRSLLEDELLARRMGAAAKARVDRKFSPQAFVSGLDKVYQLVGRDKEEAA